MEEIETAQQRPHPGFFHHPGKQAAVQPDMSAFSADIGNLSRRLRLLEESFTNMRRALQVTEQNMIAKNKAFNTELRTITSDISDIKKEVADLREKMLEMMKELQEAAKRDEVKVLEKYINYWNPIRFVTQNDVEDVVREILRKNTPQKTKK